MPVCMGRQPPVGRRLRGPKRLDPPYNFMPGYSGFRRGLARGLMVGGAGVVFDSACDA